MPEIPVDRDTLLLYAKAASDTYLRLKLAQTLGAAPIISYIRGLDDAELLSLLTGLDGNAWSMVLGLAHPRAGEPA